jgi:molybdopterin-binding protein
MRTSARNMLGEEVKEDAVNCEVTIDFLGGAEIVSVITKESAEKLGLTIRQSGLLCHPDLLVVASEEQCFSYPS